MSSVKVLLISTTVLSFAILLRFSIPPITDFAIYEVPLIYNRLVSLLKPPYLYLLINCIIITIVASSKLQSKKDDVSPPVTDLPTLIEQPAADLDRKTEYPINYSAEDYSSVKEENISNFEEHERVMNTDRKERLLVAEDRTSNKENEYVIGKSFPLNTEGYSGQIENSPSDVTKPSASARFGHRKNTTKLASPEGVKTVLGVSKLKRGETLESTWKSITEGCASPLIRRHLKTEKTIMTKAKTFNTTTSLVGRQREASLSQDELNKRVEAFINKFNEEMRLQRQESLNQYKELIKPIR